MSESEAIIEQTPPAASEPALSVHEAAAKMRRREQTDAPQESATADTSPETATSETEVGDPVEPSIEPPKSWTREERERFAALPRDLQEYLSSREQERDSAVNRRMNEAAERARAAEAAQQAALQARQQYEQLVPQLVQQMQAQIAGEFSDIRSPDDLEKLAENDPFRFAKFQASQMKLQAAQQQAQMVAQQQQQQWHHQFTNYIQAEDQAFSDEHPEFRDPQKAEPLRKATIDYLVKKVGIPEDRLPELWQNPLLRSRQFQRVAYDAMRFHQAQEKAKSALTAPKPAPQRPGVALQRGEIQQANVGKLETKLQNARGVEAIKAAAELMKAKRAQKG